MNTPPTQAGLPGSIALPSLPNAGGLQDKAEFFLDSM